jgi:hypothetical protein
MLYFALRAFRFLITFSLHIKEQFQKIKNKQLYSYPHPFPSLFFPSPSLPQSYFEMVRLCSLSYCHFFHSFLFFFVHDSVIYHYFSLATYIGSFPFFVPLFFLFNTSHPFSSLHSISLLPSAFFSCLVFQFSFPIHPLLSSQFLAPLSLVLPL